MTPPSEVRIVPFHEGLAADFDRLNRAWLVAGDFLEPADEPWLTEPHARIVAPGGQIYFAIDGTTVLGTAAAILLPDGSVELAKLAVDPAAQGRGLGRILTLQVLAFARERGASRVVLTSSTRLHAAVSLYRNLGFVEYPCPPGFGYASADVYMELQITPGVAGSSPSTG